MRKHIAQNFIARVCLLGSTFLLNIFFSRVLGASGSGELYYAINNFSIITLIASWSLESGMTYFLSRKEIGENELATISLIWSLFAGVLTAALVFFFYNDFFPASNYVTIRYSFLFISGNLLITYFSGLFFAKKQFLLPHLIPAITNVIVLILCGTLLLLKYQDNIGLMVGIYFGSFIVSGILLGFFFHTKYSLNFLLHHIPAGSLRKLLKYSSFALITNIVAFLAYRIDYWILKEFSPGVVTDTAIGNYIQVSKLVQLFLFAPTVIATIVFPASASAEKPDFNKIFKKMVGQVLFLNAIASVAIIILGKWVFMFVYGDSFSLMYQCFIFSVPAILSITVVRILASYFAGTNRIRYNFSGSLIALIVIATLNFLLIPLIGINGAALADSAGYTAYMIFLLILLKRKG